MNHREGPWIEFQPGQSVQVLDAFGKWLDKIATSGIVRGRDFAVVWVCRPDKYQRAMAEGCDPNQDAVPWPAEAVRACDRDTKPELVKS